MAHSRIESVALGHQLWDFRQAEMLDSSVTWPEVLALPRAPFRLQPWPTGSHFTSPKKWFMVVPSNENSRGNSENKSEIWDWGENHSTQNKQKGDNKETCPARPPALSTISAHLCTENTSAHAARSNSDSFWEEGSFLGVSLSAVDQNQNKSAILEKQLQSAKDLRAKGCIAAIGLGGHRS